MSKSLCNAARILLFFTAILFFAGSAFADSPFPNRFGHTFEELKIGFKLPAVDNKYGQETLLSEVYLKFSQDGTCEEFRREIWQSRLKSIGDQGTMEEVYSPWYQNQPVIKARVFDRNGKVYELAEDDSTVASAQSEDRTVLTDKMVVRTVLPGLQEGGIVEQTVTTTDRIPFFRSGTSRSFSLDSFVPTQFFSVTIEAPETLPLKVGFLGDARPIQETAKDGMRFWRLEISDPKLIDVETIERSVPVDVVQVSALVVSTGIHWKDIASEYSALVDQRLEGVDFGALVQDLNLGDGLSERERIDACKKWIQTNIRYTSVSLGEASIVPARPLQLLTRRFGDCKDQSTMLVGLLRQLGIEANVALVNSWSYRSPNPDFPSLSGFDHAIVHTKVGGTSLWIDCTFLGAGPESMPVYLQGKNALIASKNSEALTQIPVLSKAQNSLVESRLVTVESKQCNIKSEEEHSGYFAALIKNYFLTTDKVESENEINKQISQSLPNAKYSILSMDDPWSESLSFRKATNTTGIDLVPVDESRSRLDVFISKLFEELPQAFLMRSESNMKVDRKLPAQVLVPFVRQKNTIVEASERIQLDCKEGEQQEKIGCVSILRRVKKESDNKILVEMKLEVDVGILSVEELEKLSLVTSSFEDISGSWNAAVYATDLAAIPQEISLESIASLRRQWDLEPSQVTLEKYIEGLLQCAMVHEARSIAEEATQRFPEKAWSHCAKGWTWMVDELGREFYPGMDQTLAQASFRRAIELEPGHTRSAHLLTFCMLRDETGLLIDEPERNQQCIDLIRSAEQVNEVTEDMVNHLILCLIKNERYDDAALELKKLGHEREILGVRCLENTANGRWKEVEAIRDRLKGDRDTLLFVFNYARGCLVDKQRYKDASRLIGLLATVGIEDANEKSKAIASLKVVPVPKDPTASPVDVTTELLLRLATDGIRPESWGDILISTEGYNNDFGIIGNALSGTQQRVRPQSIARIRVLDLFRPQIRVTGNDENGYQCVVECNGVTDTFAVLKVEGKYKILLSGKNFERILMHAEDCMKRGETADAYKWIEWIVRLLPETRILVAESGIPAKIIWKSSRTKTPEQFERFTKMMRSTGAIEEVLADFQSWISQEKSKSKKLQYQRCLFDQLSERSPADYCREVAPFLEENPAFYGEMNRYFFTVIEQKDFEKAHALLAKWRDTLPEELTARMESKLLMYQDDYEGGLAKVHAAAKLFNRVDFWNSFFWSSMFVDGVDGVELKAAQDMLRTKGSLADLHTLACAEADVGLLREAADDLRLLVSLQGNQMKDADWLIVGLIAQKCALNESAKAAYSKVEFSDDEFSAYSLAKKKLSNLETKK